MTNALLVCKSKRLYKNMGDYVQSIAGEYFVGKDAKYVQREELYKYDGKPLKIIMNGWFMHYPKNWPPSDKLHPLFISFHINPEKATEMLDEKGVSYLKKHEPIGCRDKSTQKLLEEKGIKAYYSGCLTLTLGNTYQNDGKGDKTYFVDPAYGFSFKPFALLKDVVPLVVHARTVFKISKGIKRDSPKIVALFRAARFFRVYSNIFEKEILRNGVYINHQVLESSIGGEKQKMDYTRQLLHRYAEAKLVVTSRIHAALPCLGMKTPVILVLSDYYENKNSKRGRFEGIKEFFHIMEYKDERLKPILGFNVKNKIGTDFRLKNKKEHWDLVTDMNEKCERFVQEEDWKID